MNKHIVLQLSLIPNIGPASIDKLVQAFGSNLDFLYQCSKRDIMQAGFSEQIAQQIVNGLSDKAKLDQELNLMQKYSFSWVTRYDAEYPDLLKEVHLPPPILYWKGVLPAHTHNCLALVGSRKANNYGEQVIKLLVPDLVQAGWTLVSGGALGIDTLVHDSTVKAHGSTLAVLGSGLLKPYPSSNRNLFTKIVEHGGAVMSPFPLQMEAMPGNFPARNRIISGLSRGVVVVQAAEKSGALITAEYALEQGREVLAVPGSIDDPLSAGCHILIKQGAQLVTSAQDICSALGQEYKAHVQEVVRQTTIIHQTPKDPFMELFKKPQTIDDIIALSGLSLDKVQERLLNLQLDGLLEQDLIGRWQQVK